MRIRKLKKLKINKIIIHKDNRLAQTPLRNEEKGQGVTIKRK